MINSLKEENFSKEEGSTSDLKISNASSSSSMSWSRLKNPRIVRVSRVFGGKDRHSKVSTVRGLRDRRVRLSVPTAIQLYDLQDKLGLNQPSKVVDWLLNVAKNDIDELPPLPIPPGNYFAQNLQPLMFTNSSGTIASSQSDKEGFISSSSTVNWNEPFKQSRSNFWSTDINLQKDESKEDSEKTDEEGKHARDLSSNGAYVSSDYPFFPRSNHSSLSAAGFLNNYLNPNNPVLCLNPSHLSLCRTGNNVGLTLQREDAHNVNVFPLPSTFSGSHILLRPPGIAHPYLPSNANHSLYFDPKQINFQMFSSSTSSQNSTSNSLTQPFFSPMRPFHLSMATNFSPLQNNNGREPNKDN